MNFPDDLTPSEAFIGNRQKKESSIKHFLEPGEVVL